MSCDGIVERQADELSRRAGETRAGPSRRSTPPTDAQVDRTREADLPDRGVAFRTIARAFAIASVAFMCDIAGSARPCAEDIESSFQPSTAVTPSSYPTT
jgi:hypothetical protein